MKLCGAGSGNMAELRRFAFYRSARATRKDQDYSLRSSVERDLLPASRTKRSNVTVIKVDGCTSTTRRRPVSDIEAPSSSNDASNCHVTCGDGRLCLVKEATIVTKRTNESSSCNRAEQSEQRMDLCRCCCRRRSPCANATQQNRHECSRSLGANQTSGKTFAITNTYVDYITYRMQYANDNLLDV